MDSDGRSAVVYEEGELDSDMLPAKVGSLLSSVAMVHQQIIIRSRGAR